MQLTQKIKTEPTEERFCIGGETGCHIVKWNGTGIIYINTNMNFDHEKAKDITRSELEPSAQDKRYSNN